jgi:hypothetical protein
MFHIFSSFIPSIAWSLRMITHSLSGGGKGMKGYETLDCTMISRGYDGARLGRYNKFCFLPDKAALFLFEFHADDYKSLRLPAIPSSTSSGYIHKIFKIHCMNLLKHLKSSKCIFYFDIVSKYT